MIVVDCQSLCFKYYFIMYNNENCFFVKLLKDFCFYSILNFEGFASILKFAILLLPWISSLLIEIGLFVFLLLGVGIFFTTKFFKTWTLLVFTLIIFCMNSHILLAMG